MVSESTGLNASISIAKMILLKQDSAKKSSSSRRAATLQPSAGHRPRNHRETTEMHLSSLGVRSPPGKETTNSTVSEFKIWAQNAIDLQKSDIHRISETLRSVEGELQEFRSFMEEVRTELSENRKAREYHHQDRRRLSKLAEDVDNLEQKVSKIGSLAEERSKSGESLGKDIEIIVSDMQRVLDKAYEVDDVKENFFQLSKRFDEFEVSTNSIVATILPDPNLTGVDNLRPQSKSIQTRLNTAENAVQKAPVGQVPSKGRDQFKSQPESRAPEDKLREHSTTVNERPQRTRTDSKLQKSGIKRKHGETDTEGGTMNQQQPDLPRKRRQPLAMALVDNQLVDEPAQAHADIELTKSKAIELFSSERGISPNVHAEEMLATDTAVDVTKVPIKLPALEQLPKAKGDLNATTSEPITRRISLRKVASANNLATSAPDHAEPNLKARRMSFTGHLLTRQGEVDRRSLRRKSNIEKKLLNTPVQTLDAQAINPALLEGPRSSSKVTRTAQHTISTATPKQPSTSSQAILPSIEREEQHETSTRTTRLSQIKSTRVENTIIPHTAKPTNATPTSTSRKKQTYSCDVCSAVFAFPGGLSYVRNPIFHNLPQPIPSFAFSIL